MKIFSKTDIGLKRSSNQDAFVFKQISKNVLWSVVCDGMGGVNGGNVASEIAVKTCEEILLENFKEGLSFDEMKEISEQAIKLSNQRIFEKSILEDGLSGMGTTAIIILIDKEKICIAHVGDSRVYLKRDNETTQITVDHSFVQDLVSRGEITSAEAKVHPHRNIITRCVGAHGKVTCDINQFELLKGDIILACSDGFSNYFSCDEINELLNDMDSQIADKLIDNALNCGGSDNVTVSVIQA